MSVIKPNGDVGLFVYINFLYVYFMKPFLHSQNSVDKFGGKPSDYSAIHNFIDSSKAHLGDCRHRALLHSTFGCYIVEKVFGETITNSQGKQVSTRDIAEQHCLEDLGKIPTVQDWLTEMNFKQWMSKYPIIETPIQLAVNSEEVNVLKEKIKHLELELLTLSLKQNTTIQSYPSIQPNPWDNLNKTLD